MHSYIDIYELSPKHVIFVDDFVQNPLSFGWYDNLKSTPGVNRSMHVRDQSRVRDEVVVKGLLQVVIMVVMMVMLQGIAAPIYCGCNDGYGGGGCMW